MGNSNQRKDATLGMAHGTANGRLRKNILFHLLVKLKENICFKCGEQIQVVDDLSIEHKLPWEGRSADLFWDLNNIAFSHLRCNRPHVLYVGGPPKINCPEGMSRCSAGKHFAPINMFYKNSSNWSGLQDWCKDHRPDR